jgi:hypothetical protein
MTQRGATQVTTVGPDLNEAAYYIAFEMFHLRYYAEVFERSPQPSRFRGAFGERIGQAYEYCFLLHLRVLLDFFYREPGKRTDDVWVGHFRAVDGFESAYPKTLYSQPAGVSKISAHLNKRLAHFTEVRWKEKLLHLDMESYRQYWLGLLVLFDKFESALTGTPKDLFDRRMKALIDTCDHEDHIRQPTRTS